MSTLYLLGIQDTPYGGAQDVGAARSGLVHGTCRVTDERDDEQKAHIFWSVHTVDRSSYGIKAWNLICSSSLSVTFGTRRWARCRRM